MSKIWGMTFEEGGSYQPPENRAKHTTAVVDRRPSGFEFFNGPKLFPEFSEYPRTAEGRRAVEDRRVALDALESRFIERKEKGIIVCDLDRFKGDFNYKGLKKELGAIAEDGRYGPGDLFSTLLITFSRLQVYSKEDYARLVNAKKGEKIPPRRSLFYVPDTREAALDPKKIHGARFYLGPWDLKQAYIDPIYPTKDNGWNSGLSAAEVIVGALIFNREFGDGYDDINDRVRRDEKGVLMVRNKGEDRVRRITGEFFSKWGYYGAPYTRVAGYQISTSPARFIRDHCSTLVDKKHLDPSIDFKTQSGSEANEQMGLVIKTPTVKGLVMIDGIRYTLGTEYGGDRGGRVCKLNDEYAGVVQREEDGKLHLKKLFKLKANAGMGEAIGKGLNRYVYVTKPQMEFVGLNEAVNASPKIEFLVSNFDKYLVFLRQYSKETKRGLGSLALNEQGYAFELYCVYGEEQRFWNFARSYGIDGLRAMFAVGPGNIETVWQIAEKNSQANVLFREVADIVVKNNDYRLVREGVPDNEKEKMDKVAEVVAQYAGKLMLSSIHEGKGYDVYDVVTALRAHRRTVGELYSKYGVLGNEDQYRLLLSAFDHGGDENQRAAAFALLSEIWRRQIAQEGQGAANNVSKESDSFYVAYGESLYEQANDTTGDTEQQLAQITEYLRDNAGDLGKLEGVTIDIGCGDMKRITGPMSMLIPGIVVGVDRVVSANMASAEEYQNLRFVQADTSMIPLPHSSVKLATANWSPLNDLVSRSQQEESMGEIRRVLVEGGKFYGDVPHLEGGEGSLKPLVDEYHRLHPDETYGTLVKSFPGGHTKRFYVYPENELRALFEQKGFSVDFVHWRTASGMPRTTFHATLRSKVTPFNLH